MQVLGLRASGFGFGVSGFGFRVHGVWCRVQGSGFRAQVQTWFSGQLTQRLRIAAVAHTTCTRVQRLGFMRPSEEGST